MNEHTFLHGGFQNLVWSGRTSYNCRCPIPNRRVRWSSRRVTLLKTGTPGDSEAGDSYSILRNPAVCVTFGSKKRVLTFLMIQYRVPGNETQEVRKAAFRELCIPKHDCFRHSPSPEVASRIKGRLQLSVSCQGDSCQLAFRE